MLLGTKIEVAFYFLCVEFHGIMLLLIAMGFMDEKLLETLIVLILTLAFIVFKKMIYIADL